MAVPGGGGRRADPRLRQGFPPAGMAGSETSGGEQVSAAGRKWSRCGRGLPTSGVAATAPDGRSDGTALRKWHHAGPSDTLRSGL